MVTLKDFSTFSLVDIIRVRRNEIDVEIALTLLAHDVRDYAQLEALMLKYPEKFRGSILVEYLRVAKENMAIINSQNLEVLRWSFNNYDNANKGLLNNYDKLVNASLLPVSSPLNVGRSTPERLQGFSIYEVKELLNKLRDTKNAFMANMSSFGLSKTLKVVEAINFYDEQMLRLASSIPNWEECENLFLVDAEIKREIINDNMRIIAEEFLRDGNNYVFGTLSDKSKESLWRALANPQKKTDSLVRKKFIEMIANYTIREELEDEEERGVALRRFH